MFEEKENQSKSSLTSELRSRPIINGIQRQWVWLIVGVAALIFISFGLLYWHSQSQLRDLRKDVEQQQNDPSAKAREESNQLVDQVGKLIILPKDEQPTVATVTDLEKLKGQPFFANAELGDKVLIYTKAKKAILFRPRAHQIVELAPLTSDTTIQP